LAHFSEGREMPQVQNPRKLDLYPATLNLSWALRHLEAQQSYRDSLVALVRVLEACEPMRCARKKQAHP
jgi:hypothetical protein